MKKKKKDLDLIRKEKQLYAEVPAIYGKNSSYVCETEGERKLCGFAVRGRERPYSRTFYYSILL